MENATKALLIADAVLVAIILIAFGIKIFNSSSGVSEQAKTIGKDINSQSKIATSSAISSIDSASTNLVEKEYTV